MDSHWNLLMVATIDGRGGSGLDDRRSFLSNAVVCDCYALVVPLLLSAYVSYANIEVNICYSATSISKKCPVSLSNRSVPLDL